jgi:hypothetical protein
MDDPRSIVKEKEKKPDNLCRTFCGEGGIRTLGGPEPTTVFETVPFNHSGTSPNIKAGKIITEKICYKSTLSCKSG